MEGLKQEIPFTKVPNILLDRYLPGLSGSEVKLLLIICRKTFGFHKDKDRIALSTMVTLSGMTKTTVIQSIRNLVKQGIIQKIETTTPHSYCVEPSLFTQYTGTKNGVQKSNRGIKSEPCVVQKFDSREVQKLDSQKSTTKEKEKNSSTTISDSVKTVIKEWNTRFNRKVKHTNTSIISDISNVLNQFSVDEIIKAMDNRLVAKYYKENKPELLHRPNCFFPYLETIECDLNRKNTKLYTYDEMVPLLTEKKCDPEKFKLRKDLKDLKGRPMREYVG